ncbi:MAG: hypothetical protein LBE17_12025, partial [Treponema sp.]|nr:hypothetical protein [Treponema sp.]
MIPETVPPIIGFFSDIKDPRLGRTKCYPLIEVIPTAWLNPSALSGKRLRPNSGSMSQACRITSGEAPEDMSFIRKIALSLA